MFALRWALAVGGLALIFVVLQAVTTPRAQADDPVDLCNLLFVPEELGLNCRIDFEDRTVVAVVQAEAGPWRDFNKLRVRRIKDGPIDDPVAWLQRQVRFDVSETASVLDEWSMDADSALSSSWLSEGLAQVKSALQGLADLPAEACDRVEQLKGERGWQMRCRYDAWVVHQVLTMQLITIEGEFYAVDFRSVNERRTRHFAAIANSIRDR